MGMRRLQEVGGVDGHTARESFLHFLDPRQRSPQACADTEQTRRPDPLLEGFTLGFRERGLHTNPHHSMVHTE